MARPTREAILNLKDQGFSTKKIADVYEVHERTVRKWLAAPPKLPAELNANLDTPITISGKTVTITADWHIPLHSNEWINRMLKSSMEQNSEVLLVAGDWFNFDSLSQYDPKQATAGLEIELEMGREMMSAMLEVFPEVVYIWGNHDARLHKSLGYKIRFDSAMRTVFGELGSSALERIKFSSLDHCWIQTPRGSWYVCHPLSYSSVPLGTARKMAPIWPKSNIITAHSHHCAVGYAPDGVSVMSEAGGLFDATKTAYLQRSTTFPRWQNGYAILDAAGDYHVYSAGWE